MGWDEEDTYVGTSQGTSSRVGSCKCAAEATIGALEAAADNRVSLELVGLRTVKAFDSTIVIACLVSLSEDRVLPFLGACLAKDGHVSRYATLAVLDATNAYWVGLTNNGVRRGAPFSKRSAPLVVTALIGSKLKSRF